MAGWTITGSGGGGKRLSEVMGFLLLLRWQPPTAAVASSLGLLLSNLSSDSDDLDELLLMPVLMEVLNLFRVLRDDIFERYFGMIIRYFETKIYFRLFRFIFFGLLRRPRGQNLGKSRSLAFSTSRVLKSRIQVIKKYQPKITSPGRHEKDLRVIGDAGGGGGVAGPGAAVPLVAVDGHVVEHAHHDAAVEKAGIQVWMVSFDKLAMLGDHIKVGSK